MTDPLLGARARLRRAKELYAELDQAYDAWALKNPAPWTVVIRHNERGDELHELKKVRDISPEIAVRFGEVIHHIRASLDDMVYQLAFQNGVEPNSQVMFITRDDETRYTADIDKKLSQLIPLQRDFLKELKACGPDSSLWALHKLDIVNKHHHLLNLGLVCVGGGVHIDIDKLPNPELVPDASKFFNRNLLGHGSCFIKIPAQFVSACRPGRSDIRPVLLNDRGSNSRMGAFDRVAEMHYWTSSAINFAQNRFFGGLSDDKFVLTFDPQMRQPGERRPPPIRTLNYGQPPHHNVATI